MLEAVCVLNSREVLLWPWQAGEEIALEQYVKGYFAIFLSLTYLIAHPTPLFGHCKDISNSVDLKRI